MRIALVTPSKLPFSCGNSLLAERIRAGLSVRGHDARIFSTQCDSIADAVHFEPDIVHSLHAIKPARWLAGLFDSCAPPWAITLTGTDYNSPEEYGAEHEMIVRQFAEASAVIVFHEEARRHVAESFAAAAEKLVVIPQGIHIREGTVEPGPVRARYGVAADEVLYFMAAGIRPVKNIIFALEVFSEVCERFKRARLILAGPVIDNSEAARIFEKGGDTPGFSYIGEIAPSAVRELMAASDIFLNVSLHEGMSGAILEAMAEGVPVLASDAPGNRALVRHNVTGLLAPSSRHAEFAEAALRLASDSQLRQEMGRAARLMAAGFSEAREIESYERLYKSMLEKTSREAGPA